MTATAGKAVGSRIGGHRASRPKAFFVSVTAGLATASLMYRWLRSGEPDDG
jgi:hypothetical protein